MILGAFGTPSRSSLAGLVAGAFVRLDLPDATEEEVAAAERHLDESLVEMPDVSRLGLRTVSAAAYLALTVLGGAPYRQQKQAVQSRAARRLASSGLPLLGEFASLARGLGLVAVLESRAQRGPL